MILCLAAFTLLRISLSFEEERGVGKSKECTEGGFFL